ncbi:hypothetical protein GC089_04070 [Cellulomonas sp. JZ18]|uniref:hypothetical protein n=1 Tax=Cellulomonas sp. JZ18 TaxID=2654191 RepID=UPI0012D403EB|nr:hypothetical protein [Cellulomonas sp. JZ18]QGQ18575.1 hypothetical protein GC089_04070 [Cellulomonas sp. JZ18]
MSTRLDLALTDIADAAGRASTLARPSDPTAAVTVHRIAARVRRRRAVRAGAGGAVAASAAGAVALVAPGLASSPVVAARPDAVPGTCGSSVADLPAPDARLESLAVAPQEALESDLRPTDRLGSWGGSTATLAAWRALPQEVPGAELVVSGTDTAPLTPVVADDGVVVAVSTPDELQVTVSPWYEPDSGDDRTGPRPEDVGEDETLVLHRLGVDLRPCDDPDGRLPAGEYDVVLLDRASPTAEADAARWVGTLEVAPPRAPLAGLPEDFPASVPLVEGRLLSVRHPAPDHWVLHVDAPEDDLVREAEDLLYEAAGPGYHVPDDRGTWFWDERAGWRVQVLEAQRSTGEPSLVYVVRTGDWEPEPFTVELEDGSYERQVLRDER